MNRRDAIRNVLVGGAALVGGFAVSPAAAAPTASGPVDRRDVVRDPWQVPYHELVSVHRFDLWMATSAVWVAASNVNRARPRSQLGGVRRKDAIEAARSTLRLHGTQGLMLAGPPGKRAERATRRRAVELFPELVA